MSRAFLFVFAVRDRSYALGLKYSVLARILFCWASSLACDSLSLSAATWALASLEAFLLSNAFLMGSPVKVREVVLV